MLWELSLNKTALLTSLIINLQFNFTAADDKALKFGNSAADYIMYQPDMGPLQDAFSACSWARSVRGDGAPSWLSYAVSGSINEILISDDGSYNHIFDQGWNLSFYFSGLSGAGKWFHYCYTWSYSSLTQRIYLNGQQIGSRSTAYGRRLQIGGVFLLGNDQDGSPGNGLQDYNAFGGELYKTNLFSKELSSSEIQEMAQNKCSDVERKYGEMRVIKWEDIQSLTRNGDVTDSKSGCKAIIGNIAFFFSFFDIFMPVNGLLYSTSYLKNDYLEHCTFKKTWCEWAVQSVRENYYQKC